MHWPQPLCSVLGGGGGGLCSLNFFGIQEKGAQVLPILEYSRSVCITSTCWKEVQYVEALVTKQI